MFEVVYYSRSGNTRKVAEAIADELGVVARDITTVITVPPDSYVFLGSGCYGAALVDDITRFIEKNHMAGRKIALFTTSLFGLSAEVKSMQKRLADKGVIITDSFACLGRLGPVKKNHPTPAELDDARSFSRMVADNVNSQKTRVPEPAGVTD
jgi:flavodoxin I